jgi:hypothetical protein
MTNKQPIGPIEIRLMKKEKWKLAEAIQCYWHEDDCYCDFCKAKITGRHLIDGKVRGSFEFGLMCPKCHSAKGEGFGEGKGQLFTRTNNQGWILTFGFTSDQLMEIEDEEEDED